MPNLKETKDNPCISHGFVLFTEEGTEKDDRTSPINTAVRVTMAVTPTTSGVRYEPQSRPGFFDRALDGRGFPKDCFRWKERELEDVTNPMDFRLCVLVSKPI